MKRQSFIANLLIITGLILNFGLTFGENVEQTAPKERVPNSEPNAEELELNPFAELLGFASPVFPNLDDTASEIAKTIDEHKEALEKALGSQREIMDSHMEDVMNEHTRQLDVIRDQFKDFDKEFDEFYKPMEEEFERLAAPLTVPIVIPDETQPVQQSGENESNSKTQSEPKLLIYHPIETVSLSDKILDSLIGNFHPVLKELHEDVQNRNNASQKGKEENTIHFTVDHDYDITANRTETNGTFNSNGGLMSDFLNTIVGSFERIFAKSVTEEEDHNETTTTTDKWEMSRDRMCGCPEAMFGRHLDDCPMKKIMAGEQKLVYESDEKPSDKQKVLEDDKMFAQELEDMAQAIDMKRDGLPFPLKTDRIDSLLKLAEIENRLEARLRWEWNIPFDDNQRDGQSVPTSLTIEQKLRHEINIVAKNDDYEWYDWTLIAIIAGTSVLLLLIALFVCVQKSRYSKKCKLSGKTLEEGEQGVQLKSNNGLEKDSIPNENLGNKYTDKIKTIFVNLN